jgi:serine protease Do
VVFIKVISVEKATQGGPGFGFPPSPFGDNPPFPFRPPGPPGGRRQGSGSGFLIRKDGVILTNNHVVEDAKEIVVTLSDKKEYPAKVLGRDPKTDLAVLKIEPKGELSVAQLGDSDKLQVGDWVMAIGNPFGLSNTVTAGIVSAKGRVIGAGPYDDFIQTDASINPGNSGGPLFNEQGEVVGINSAIFSQGGGNVGIGFAIPVNLAKQLLPELETTGNVTRGWLGVSIQKMTPELAKSLGLEGANGALVADVTNESPAAKGGVERGDVIVRYNGKEVENSTSLPSLVAATPVGKTVPVEVVRNGKAKTLDVTIAKLTEDEVANVDEEGAPQKGKWGLALRELRPEEREQMGLRAGEGVMVGGVQPDSPATEAGVQVGDVILQVNKTSVATVAEVKKEIGKAATDAPLLLLLRRADGNNRFATLAAK